jgi:hypothetical protein
VKGVDGGDRLQRISGCPRRRAGVVGLAEDLDVEPAQALNAGDDPDGLARVFEQRALLDCA